MDPSKTDVDQEAHAHQMRIRIAKLHHSQYLQAVLIEHGTVTPGKMRRLKDDAVHASDVDVTFTPPGLKVWNDKCDKEFAKFGHTNTNFLDCTCVENKDITG